MAAEEEKEDNIALVGSIVDALNTLPIVERLEFVRNLVCDRGGEKDNFPRDPALVTAVRVLDSVMAVLRQHPEAAGLRILKL